jgi:hypothetical protein
MYEGIIGTLVPTARNLFAIFLTESVIAQFVVGIGRHNVVFSDDPPVFTSTVSAATSAASSSNASAPLDHFRNHRHCHHCHHHHPFRTPSISLLQLGKYSQSRSPEPRSVGGSGVPSWQRDAEDIWPRK